MPNINSNSNLINDNAIYNKRFDNNLTKLKNPYKKVKKIKTVKFNLGKNNNYYGFINFGEKLI